MLEAKIKTMSLTPNDKLQFILGRRSIRVYAPGEVSEMAITQLLQAAMAAPSAVARDPWRFVVIRKKETLSAIAAALPNGGMLATAPGLASLTATMLSPFCSPAELNAVAAKLAVWP